MKLESIKISAHIIYFHLNLLLLQKKKKNFGLVIGRESKGSRKLLVLDSHDHFVITKLSFGLLFSILSIVESYCTLKKV